MRWGWFPDWSGDTAIVIASGPSAALAPMFDVGPSRVIAVNESWRLAPWADVLYCCDPGWWVRRSGAREFKGARVTADQGAAEHFGLHHITVREGDHRVVLEPLGVIGDGGNSGFQAVNLAVQFGARRIVLVGFDLQPEEPTHWHGAHGGGLANPQQEHLRQWAERLDSQSTVLRAAGVDVLNGSPHSALTAYPKVDLREVL